MREDWLRIIGDRHSLRLLVALHDGPPRTLYSLSRETGTYPRTTRSRLKLLADNKLVLEERLGGIQTYRVDPSAIPDEVRVLLSWLRARVGEKRSL